MNIKWECYVLQVELSERVKTNLKQCGIVIQGAKVKVEKERIVCSPQ